MISSETLRRWPFFSGLSHEQVDALARVATETTVEEGHYFFHESDELAQFFVVLEGNANIVIETPERGVEQKLAAQYLRQLQTTDVVVATVGPGEMFGWSALVFPHTTTAGALAASSCRVAVFDANALNAVFQEDCHFGYLMMQKAAQVIRARLRNTRVESLSLVTK